ncbi:MAG: FG-GAP-like repeat-containing protein, partial [Acidobacteriota bacterium]|nr:FG-GAP-like repeat-containing protein [Acidobacteriota bacterium]
MPAAAMLAAGLLVLGCGPASTSSPPDSDGPTTGKVVASFSGTDQNGATLTATDLRGRVWVAHLFATTCERPCSEVVATMTRIQNEFFNHQEAGSIRLVSVSVDPVTDTVSALAGYARTVAYAYGDRWHFLTAPPDQVAALAGSLGLDPGDFTGESLPGGERIAIVDRDGRARGTYAVAREGELSRLFADLEVVLAESSTSRPRPAPELPRVPYPPEAENPEWLGPRKDAQLSTAGSIDVFHDFRFEDRVDASGITFVNRVVDDAGRDYKGVHYDHGNGLAVADVDGDGLLDLYFTTQLGRNQLWRNRGDGTFENLTAVSGTALGERISVTASFADVDNDGDPDLFVTTVNDGNVLFRNDGDGRFTDVSAASGLDHAGHSSGAVFFDFDRDGALDLFVTNIGRYTTGKENGRGGYDVGFADAFSGHVFPERTEYSILYRNVGDGRFADVTSEMGIHDGSWSGDASPIDYDEDGWVDLYLLDMQGDDELYRNLGGEGFKRVSRTVFPETSWGAMGIKVFDVDGDGRMDLFISDMHSDMSDNIGPEKEKLKSEMKWSESALGHGGHHALGDEGPSVFGNTLFMARD